MPNASIVIGLHCYLTWNLAMTGLGNGSRNLRKLLKPQTDLGRLKPSTWQ